MPTNSSSSSEAIYCVVGLGNPGEQYKGTRHNIGFEVADRLAGRSKSSIRRRENSALTANVKVGRTEVLIMKPQTYMNRSGDAVAAIAQQRGIPAGRVVVVYDDMDLPLGRLRLRSGGGSGGHNGIKSISQELGDNSFLRVRVGVGRPDSGMDPVEHVLSGFGEDQNEAVDAAVERAVDATCALINDGLGPAMDRFNRKVVEVAG